MTQADRVHSTPPTNTSATTPKSSRRGFLVGAAAGGAAIGAGLPLPAPPTAAAQSPDAELIEFGTQFEPLVDRYYVAQRRWSRSLAAAQARSGIWGSGRPELRVAASRDLSDEESRPVLKLKHHEIANFTEKHGVNVEWLLEGKGRIFKKDPIGLSPNMTGGELAAVVAKMPAADQQVIRAAVREILQERDQ
jgi:hypothetical protein